MFAGKLYIRVGELKPTSKQFLANPKADICAFYGSAWMRIIGKLIEDNRVEARKSMLYAYPSLRKR